MGMARGSGGRGQRGRRYVAEGRKKGKLGEVDQKGRFTVAIHNRE